MPESPTIQWGSRPSPAGNFTFKLRDATQYANPREWILLAESILGLACQFGSSASEVRQRRLCLIAAIVGHKQ